MERKIEMAKAVGRIEAVKMLIDIDRRHSLATDDHTMKIFQDAIEEIRKIMVDA